MNTRYILRALGLGLAFAGCTDETYRYGGEIQTIHLSIGDQSAVTASAFLYSDYVPATGEPEPSTFPYASIPVDSCIPRPQFPADGQYLGLDVGAEIQIAGEGGPLTLPQTADPQACGGATLCYLSDFASGAMIPPGSRADVSWPGSDAAGAATWTDAIRQPDPVVVTQPDPTVPYVIVPTSGDLSFRWVPGTSDIMLIAFLTSQYQVCRVTDDGAFDVPAATVAAAGVTTAGTIAIVRGEITTKDLKERTVNVIPLTGRGWVPF